MRGWYSVRDPGSRVATANSPVGKQPLLRGSYTVYSIKRSVYSVQCTVYSVQCTVNSVQCTVYSVQCTVFMAPCVQCVQWGDGFIARSTIQFTAVLTVFILHTPHSTAPCKCSTHLHAVHVSLCPQQVGIQPQVRGFLAPRPDGVLEGEEEASELSRGWRRKY